MSSFNDLRQIYEGFQGYPNAIPAPNSQYTPQQANPKLSFPQMAVNVGHSGAENTYQVNAMAPQVRVIDDDEEEQTSGAILKQQVVDKINELMGTAAKDEMMYAVHLFGQLKECIKSIKSLE